jgi:hypothetical protein
MRFRFVLPLPAFVLHPLTAVVVAAVHVYLAAGHLSQLIGGDVELTHFWKGFGALGGAYVFLALASRGLASQEGRTFAQALHGRAKERVLNRHQHEGWLETNLLV